jgi:hypothetical protein
LVLKGRQRLVAVVTIDVKNEQSEFAGGGKLLPALDCRNLRRWANGENPGRGFRCGAGSFRKYATVCQNKLQ